MDNSITKNFCTVGVGHLLCFSFLFAHSHVCCLCRLSVVALSLWSCHCNRLRLDEENIRGFISREITVLFNTRHTHTQFIFYEFPLFNNNHAEYIFYYYCYWTKQTDINFHKVSIAYTNLFLLLTAVLSMALFSARGSFFLPRISYVFFYLLDDISFQPVFFFQVLFISSHLFSFCLFFLSL